MTKNKLNLPKIEKERLEYRKAIILAVITSVTSVIVTAIPAYFLGRQQGKENATVKLVESESKPAYQDEVRNKESQVTDKQNQIQILRRTIDFLMGKTGKLNEKVDDYERKLKIPQKGKIILFEHVNYKGHRCDLKLGEDVPDLSLYGFGNTVSSVKIEGAVRARAYSEVNYAIYPFLEIESDMPLLADYWNDRILSISVETK